MKTKQIEVNGVQLIAREDGVLIRTKKTKNVRKMQVKGTCDDKGYRRIRINKKLFLAHRIIAMAFLKNYSESLHVDHISGDKSDNSVTNLRMATRSQNDRSFKTKSKGKSSRFRGVCFNSGRMKWQANCKVNGKTIYGGLHSTEEGAAIAYDKLAEQNGFNPQALNRNNHDIVTPCGNSKII